MSSESEVRGGALALRTDQAQWDDRQRAALAQLGLVDVPDGDLAVFLHVCQRTGLDPFARQIHMIGRREKRRDGTYGMKYTIQTGIDGLRVIAARTGKYLGRGGPWWCGEDGQWRDAWLPTAPPAAARACVFRAGEQEPTYGVALWREYAQTGQDGRPQALWAGKPAHMLGKVAEAIALRAAFPQDMGGLYTDDEMPARHTATVTARGTATAAVQDTAHQVLAVAGAERPRHQDWDSLDAAFVEWYAVNGASDSGWPARLKEISRLLGRTVTKGGQMTRDEVLTVAERLAAQTATAADAAYMHSQQDTAPAVEVIDAEVIEE